MTTAIHPARPLAGSITVPGDETISRDYAIVAALAEGVSKLQNFSRAPGPHATLDALRALGVNIEESGTEVAIHGIGLDPRIQPLATGTKASVLVAGLFGEGETIFREPVRTPDHLELALRYFGAGLAVERRIVTLQGGRRLAARDVVIPGDLGITAYFLVAALLVPESDLYLKSVGLNPTRSALLDFLAGGGANLRLESVAQVNAELMGDMRIRHSRFRGGEAPKDILALAILAPLSEEGITFPDGISPQIADNLCRMGIRLEGSTIPGKQAFHAAALDGRGDDRIAMACVIAALAADGECEIEHTASTAFTEFVTILEQVTEA